MLLQEDHGGVKPTTDTFRAAMQHLPGNVAVVTVGTGSERSGLVVTSAVSLAADPPLVMVCVNRSSSSWPLFHRFGHFGVNSLAAHQQDIAERFSGRHGCKGSERYVNAEWTTLSTGAPLLVDATVSLDCTLEEMIDRATHSIIIGRVNAIRVNEDQGALIYWHGGYRTLQR
ncbi:flavin reductase family protein [Rhizobium grahamii]|uniref:Flavin reductase n=1 Tax=Rhizobium grahamii TaxID=1120045 RepID=A0A370KIZ0_9HYPH|nr:flavin reductase family protein [Rhizobium grahamii]RDJ04845.1 flavin reductase [Rhizobium grahamii]